MIFEAIAAVKIANDAIAAIKEMAGNVQSVGDFGKHITRLTEAEEAIQKKADDGCLESFMELEKIKNHKESIKTMMIYSGRAGLYEDFLRHQRIHKERKENERKRIAAKKARKKRLIKEWCLGLVVGALLLSGIGVIFLILYWVMKHGN